MMATTGELPWSDAEKVIKKPPNIFISLSFRFYFGEWLEEDVLARLCRLGLRAFFFCLLLLRFAGILCADVVAITGNAPCGNTQGCEGFSRCAP
jgi:hypothetical protein